MKGQNKIEAQFKDFDQIKKNGLTGSGPLRLVVYETGLVQLGLL